MSASSHSAGCCAAAGGLPPELPSAASTLAYYSREASRLAGIYESLGDAENEGRSPFASLFARWIPAGARVLEIGCGSGRDARFLAARGAIVTATDGSPEMIRAARRLALSDPRHQSGRLRFEALPLPPQPESLARLSLQRGGPEAEASAWPSFFAVPGPATVVCAMGVLQHLDENELYQTAVFLDQALDPNEGEILIAVPLDHAQDGERRYANRAPEHYAALFERFGFVEASRELADDAGPDGSRCRWASLVFVRDAGQRRARMNLRSLIENDSKTSTYKFALLRALCDVNIANPGRAAYEAASPEKAPRLVLAPPDAPANAEKKSAGDPQPAVAGIPFSLVIERIAGYYWTARHRGAQSAAAPSAPPRQIAGGRPLAFDAELEALAALYSGDWISFREDYYSSVLARSPESKRARAAAALFDAVARTLKKGPIWYAGNSLAADPGLDHNLLFQVAGGLSRFSALDPTSAEARYGRLYLPAAVWRELTRTAPDLADTTLLEWAKLSARFGQLARKTAAAAPPASVGAVLEWLLPPESERDVAAAKAVYAASIPQGLACVWTGRPLTARTLAVDHLVPWSRIHSNDLWNLVPAYASANSSKSDAIPTMELMSAAADRLCVAWRLMEREKSALFRAQAENAVFGRALPKTQWETPLFDAVLRTADEVARQFGARRWSGLAA